MAQYGLWVLAIYGAVALVGLVVRLLANHTPPTISLVLVVRDCADIVESVVRQVISLLRSSRDATILDFFIVNSSRDQLTGDIILRLIGHYPEIKLISTSDSDEDEKTATAQALSLANGEVVWVARLEPGKEPAKIVDQLEFLVQRHVSFRTSDPGESSVN